MAISASGNLVFLDFTRRELSYVIKKKKRKKNRLQTRCALKQNRTRDLRSQCRLRRKVSRKELDKAEKLRLQ